MTSGRGTGMVHFKKGILEQQEYAEVIECKMLPKARE